MVAAVKKVQADYGIEADGVIGNSTIEALNTGAKDRARILAELPWWIRNVAVKVLLRLRLRPAARVLFGHRGPYDPY